MDTTFHSFSPPDATERVKQINYTYTPIPILTMPSLSDTLAQLSVNSTHIHEYAKGNIKPSGPYATAYLHCLTVPDLIRDGTDPERRAFGFIGEGNDNVKKAEKREGPVTPLKDLAIVKGRGGEEIEIVLRTAARLVDD